MKSHLTTAALLALSPLSLQGAITYIDSVEGSSGNTFATTGGSLGDTSWVASGTQDNSDIWGKRTPLANDGTIFEARNNGSGDGGVPLTTQITGLADGTYNVWAFYWVNGSQNWDILAGLELGSLTKYNEDGGGVAVGTDSSTLSFTNTPPFMTSEDGTRFMYGINLGTATVSSGSPTINIFIDADGSALSGTERSWYDGVGYELIPEPSTALLGGLGALLLLRRRRA